MPGNELEVCKYLFNKLNQIKLRHLGVLKRIEAPNYGKIETFSDIDLLATEDSRKKADFHINGRGVSVKQVGGSFSFNRLQRANILGVFSFLKFSNTERIVKKIDAEVLKFHQGLLGRRNRPWVNFFEEGEFKALLEFLMMKGSPNVGISTHPADLILEAPPIGISNENIAVYTFEEYFNKYRQKFKIAIRRQWIGQTSKSEHGRATSLAKKPGNKPWVLDDVVGEPRTGWRSDFPASERKTVYFLMIEKES